MAAGMGLLISPDHLRLWGNLAGHIGTNFWVITFAASAIFALTVVSYRRLAFSGADANGYLKALHAQGGLIAVSLALASRLVLTIGISTGVLVTAGFVFNETFVYWFPNFAFAFLFLALVALVLFMGYGLAEKVLTVLLGIALLGLLVLVVSGLIQTGPEPAADALPAPGFSLRAVFSAMLLFVGFDLGIHRIAPIRDSGTSTATMLVVLGFTAAFLGLWGTVSLDHVPANRLAGTSIPYTLAAREIAGQTGRLLMGLVVIAGAGSAVLSLFSATARMVASLARLEMLPRFCRGSAHRNTMVISILASAVATMMAAGLAGEPELEIFIRAGFLLWLLHAALVHLAAAKTHDPNAPANMAARSRRTSWLTVLAAMLIGTGTIYLWFTDADRVRLATTLILAWSAGVMMLFPVWFGKHRTKPPGLRRSGSQ